MLSELSLYQVHQLIVGSVEAEIPAKALRLALEISVARKRDIRKSTNSQLFLPFALLHSLFNKGHTLARFLTKEEEISLKREYATAATTASILIQLEI